MNTTQPRWQDLVAKLLQQDHLEDTVSEVEPYQAQPALGFDLTLAWNEALLPGELLADEEPRRTARFPSAWQTARYVTMHGPFPCCVGMAPQFLQKIDRFLSDSSGFFQQDAVSTAGPMIAEVTLDNKSILSQLAIARLAGDAEQVDRLVNELPGETLQKNERAAQAWLAGDRENARGLWDSLPGDHPVVAFNQGLAALAAGEQERGRACLERAVAGFAESTGWHHLAELYLAVSE